MHLLGQTPRCEDLLDHGQEALPRTCSSCFLREADLSDSSDSFKSMWRTALPLFDRRRYISAQFFLACSPTSSRVDTRSFDILHPPTSRSSVLKSSRCLPNTPTSSPSAPSLPCSRHTTTVPVCCFDQHFDHFQHRLTNSHRRCRQRLGHQCFLPLRHLPASHGPLPDL